MALKVPLLPLLRGSSVTWSSGATSFQFSKCPAGHLSEGTLFPTTHKTGKQLTGTRGKRGARGCRLAERAPPGLATGPPAPFLGPACQL